MSTVHAPDQSPNGSPDQGAQASSAAASTRRVALVTNVRGASIVIALAVLVLGVAIRQPRFVSGGNIEQILLSASIVAILAAGQTMVIVTGNIDLSIGSVVGLSAYVTADLLRSGAPIPAAIAAALVVGVLAGALNGALIAAFDVPAIVVTLGTLSIYRGLVFVIAQGRQVSASDVPDSFLRLTSASTAGVPHLVVFALVVVGVIGAAMRLTTPGRHLYAIGSNPDAADAIGLRRRRLLFATFVLSGLVASVAGVLWASRFATVDANSATGIELDIIAAAVVGGVSILGGSGTVVGAVLGAVLLTCIANALAVLNVDAFWLQAIRGGVILVALAADARIRAYLDRLLSRGGRR